MRYGCCCGWTVAECMALGLAGQYTSVSKPSAFGPLSVNGGLLLASPGGQTLAGLSAVQLPTTPCSGSWLLCGEGWRGHWCRGGW